MRKIIYTILLTILSTNIWAEIALYTLDDPNSRPITDMYKILSHFTENYPDRNILFYVHGRNKRVADEIANLPILEKNYHVKVVMFHWNAYDTLVSRPVRNAKISSDQLLESLEIIRTFKQDHFEFFSSHSINLLCHSMGNLVLKYAVEQNFANDIFQEKIFTNYISVGADVPLKLHKEWLSQFNMANQNYIMMNNRDIVLLLSYVLDLKERRPLYYRLGLGFDNFPGWRDDIKTKLVPTTQYIDLSATLVADHGYFKGTTKIMKTIFNRLINGKNFIENEKNLAVQESDPFRVKQDKKEKNIFYVLK